MRRWILLVWLAVLGATAAAACAPEDRNPGTPEPAAAGFVCGPARSATHEFAVGGRTYRVTAKLLWAKNGERSDAYALNLHSKNLTDAGPDIPARWSLTVLWTARTRWGDVTMRPGGWFVAPADRTAASDYKPGLITNSAGGEGIYTSYLPRLDTQFGLRRPDQTNSRMVVAVSLNMY